jgi:hypothetical protein
MLSRLKFNIQDLVNEILDKLPGDVWTSSVTTFFDPSIAGGQFVKEIEKRLSTHGHSRDNIASRVSGLANTELSLNYTINRHHLIGNYAVGGIEELEKMSKKFDVIVGNPPYQAPTQGNGNNNKLWPLFVEVAVKLAKEDGIISFITPTSGLAPANKTLQIFKNHHLTYVDFDAKKHFSGIGSQISSWQLLVNKKGTTAIGSLTLDLADVEYFPAMIESFSIHKKVIFENEGDRLDVMSDETSNVILVTKKPNLVSREKTRTHIHKAFHTNHQFLWASRELRDEKAKKVVFTTSGYLKAFYDEGTIGVSNTSRYILVDSKEKGEVLASLLNSSLYQFIMETAKWNGFVNVNVIKALPLLDLTRSWTDTEMYAHFNLIEEEINLIEEHIK